MGQTPQAPRGTAIALLEAPPGGRLTERELCTASQNWRFPVHLRGLCQSETIGDKWTLRDLLSLEPDMFVAAEYYVDADRRKPYQHITKSFRDVATAMAAEPQKWFLAELDFDDVFPQAADRLPPLSVLPEGRRHEARLVFFGIDTQSATHFHTQDQAILLHLRGNKRVILAEPNATKDLASNSVFGGRPQFSDIGPEPGADAFETFARAIGDQAVEVVLEPGDALFIPVHWWHWVEGRGECLSVTTFWRSSIRDWAWPHPGMRAAVAVGTGHVKRLLLRLLGRSSRR